ncbi:MAG: flagellar M-ring protein FliF, partial [Alphaproteobacteria bacterium]|nr:flagellar M-ring protein FliF [Alphaproteobacteria bacterium]
MDSFFETLKNLGAGRLAVMLVTFFGLVVFFIFVAARSNTPGMTLLYSQLSTADATEIAAKLDNMHIAYRLSTDGTQVMVEQKDVGKARMLLAADGLPSEGSVGYEIFDQKQAFGTTRFVENIDAQRALEGELARTVDSIDGVRSARIQLVLPQRELFSNNETPASASVFLSLRNTANITQGQIHAIQHLIAAAVPRLNANNVAIIDQDGNLLAQGQGGSDDYSAGDDADITEKYDMRTARAIEDMVGRIVGYGNVRANVTAEMDFDQVSSNSESYNPDGQVVRSTQSDTTNSVDNSSSNNANGAVSVSTNLPGLPNGGASGGTSATPASKHSTDQEITNYEISKTVENMRRAPGQVKKISVAVLVDGKYVPDTSAKKPANAPADWQPPQKYIPLSAAEIGQITELVKSAIGYNAARGDSVQVVNMQFAQEPVPVPPKDTSQLMGFQKSDLLNVAETLALSIVAALVVLLVLRPLALHMIESAPRLPG